MTVAPLGYISMGARDPAVWQSFGYDVLGLAVGSGAPADTLWLLLDGRPFRMERADRARLDDARFDDQPDPAPLGSSMGGTAAAEQVTSVRQPRRSVRGPRRRKEACSTSG